MNSRPMVPMKVLPFFKFELNSKEKMINLEDYIQPFLMTLPLEDKWVFKSHFYSTMYTTNIHKQNWVLGGNEHVKECLECLDERVSH